MYNIIYSKIMDEFLMVKKINTLRNKITSKECFSIFIFLVWCNYCITSSINFFLHKIKRHFRFSNVGFLGIISWGQGYYDLSIIKKRLTRAQQVGDACALWVACAAPPNAFGSLPRWRSKHHDTLYTVGRYMLAFMIPRSSWDNFFLPPLSLSSTSKGVMAL